MSTAVQLSAPLDLLGIRREFPVLATAVRGQPLVYLDTAASAQRPREVIEAEAEFALRHHANVHRGVHTLSQEATQAFDDARAEMARFIGAADPAEVVITSGTTGSLNLVAQSLGRSVLRPGDEILLTELEHHSNIVPWQLVRSTTGAVIRVVPITEAGELDLAALHRLVGPKTRIIATTHVSNVLGTVVPVARIVEVARSVNALVVVDGAQAAPHLPVSVRELGCDFYAASAHKLYGPTGIGFLYGRAELLDRMPPATGGGGMIQRVTFEETTFAPPPARFEAGTPPIAQAVGFAAALRYLSGLPGDGLRAHEADVVHYARERIGAIPGIRVLGPEQSVAVVSFVVEGVHPHDVGSLLDLRGVAVRAGHHCAQPLMTRLGVPGTVRASFGVYSTRQDVDALVDGLVEVRKVFV